MEEKAKKDAKELIQRFMEPIDELHNYPMCFDTSKQCAIIAIEIIISIEFKYYPNDLSHWEEVYEELEKLKL